MSNAAVLDLEQVTWRADDRAILEAVSWRVGRGEHWVLLGPNGAGKTTLLKLACGYIWPNGGGRILRNGEEFVDLRELRRSIGWVSSALSIQIPRDEIVLHTVLSGESAQIGFIEWQPVREEDRQRARQNLAELGCEQLADRQFGTLSQGEQQKVLIARAKMTKPMLIILDEPCAGLDPGAREVFLRAIQEMAEGQGDLSLVFVTHHIEEIMPAFGKTLVLKTGRVVRQGDTGEVVRPGVLREIYGVPIEVHLRNGRYWPICG